MAKNKNLVFPEPDIPLSKEERDFCIEWIIRGKEIRDAWAVAFDNSKDAYDSNAPLNLAKRPKIKQYCEKLNEYFDACYDVGAALSGKVLDLDGCLHILSNAAHGKEELSSSRAKAIDMLLRYYGAYNKSETKNYQQNVSVVIQGSDDADEDEGDEE